MRQRFGSLLLIGVVIAMFRYSEVAAFGLNNYAGLQLLAPWQQATSHAGFLPCQSYGQFSTIETLLRMSLRLDSHNSGTVSNLGRVLWIDGRCESARAMWQKALDSGQRTIAIDLLRSGSTMDFDPELSSDLAQYAYNIALAFQKENQEDETIAWFSISHRLDPSFRVAERLAGMYSKQGLQEVAVPVWQALYDNLPSNDPQKWWATGQIAEIRTDWFAAAEAYGKGANLTSEPYEYLMRQAYAFQQGQGLEQAASVYEVARAEKPDHPQPYLALGNLAILQGAFDRAIDWYLAAERLKIEHNDSLAGLGHAHFLKEDYDLARRYLESALQMEPDDYWAAYLLSQCLYMTGDQLQATEALNRAISNHPGQPWQWALILGDWYYEMDNGEGALKAFQLAEKWKGPTDEIESRIQNVTKQ